ncbi:MAG: hypothetical protein ACK5BQ_07950, partial [Ignavibacteria bacterium]
MKTRTMLPLFVAAMLIFALQSVNAQLREPEVLPGLLWVRSDTLPGHEMMWKLEDSTLSNPTPIITDFEIGWNWTTVPWNVGKQLATRRYHCNDYRLNAETTLRDLSPMQTALQRDGLPNMQLVPCVKGIGQSESVRKLSDYATDLGEEREDTNPSETVAMEFAPWLYPVGSTEHFDLKDNDASGAVFGWRTHRRGQPVSTAGTYRMRYVRQNAGNPPITGPILEDATPNGELRAWTPWNSPYNKYRYRTQNTKIMELAVTLRRTEENPATGGPDDAVVTIMLPYALGTNNLGSMHIRFAEVPIVTSSIANLYDLHGRPFTREIRDTLAAIDATKFTITRRMLPAMSDSSEVTLIAKFYCDDSTNHNPKIRDEDGKTADSTEIGKMGITVWHNDDPATGLGVEIRNMRLQTPEAGRLLTGQHDERIQRSANRFLEDLKAIQDTLPNFLPSTRVPPSFKVWMFYGRDEGPKCYWKSYRYINKLLGGRLMTEVNVEDAKEFLHCTQFKVLWQGATPTATPHIATYSYQKGFNDTLQAPPEDSITPGWLRDARVRRGYANIRYCLGNMMQSPNGSVTEYHDDPDTFQEWRGDTTINGTPTRPALPVPEALVDHVLQLTPRDESRGVLTNLEQMLLLDYKANKKMLFGSTPWLAQVWLNYHMQVRGLGGGDSNFAWFLNNRPRTIGETRTALWLPLILGAKGLMLYRGTTSREGSAAPFDSTPALFEGPNKQPADNLEGGLLGYFRLDSLAHGSVSNSIDSSWLRSMASGDDWISANDSTYVDRYFYPGLNRVAANLRGHITASAQDSIYVGTYTGRNVTLDVLKRLHDMRTKLGKGLNGRVDSMPHVLTTLRLESWYGHGFTTISMSRDTANPLARFVDVSHIRERLRTRHPYRNRDVVPSQDIPGHVSYESYDSSFYDITMMSSADDRPMTNSCVISVFNRRTDPRMLAQSTDLGIYRYRQQ